MSQYVRLIFFTLILSYLLLCSIVFFYQRSLIYHPTPSLPVEASKITTLAVDNASLKVSIRELETDNAIIYFGGNAETVASSLPKYANAFPNHAIYMPHYRGYSGSTGTPTEAALHKDAEKLYDLVRSKHSTITVIGRSLGSGVAIRLAATHEVTKLVLVTPYDSILNLSKQRFPYLPIKFMLKDTFESWRSAPQVKAPTIILAAENDHVIPKENAEALYAKFSAGVATFKVIKNVDHHSISLSPEYFPLMQND